MDNKHDDLLADVGPFIGMFNVVSLYLAIAIAYMLLT